MPPLYREHSLEFEYDVSCNAGRWLASASIGGSHACAVARLRTDPVGTPRRVFCWGDNQAGQVNQPPSLRVLEPVEVALPL